MGAAEGGTGAAEGCAMGGAGDKGGTPHADSECVVAPAWNSRSDMTYERAFGMSMPQFFAGILKKVWAPKFEQRGA